MKETGPHPPRFAELVGDRLRRLRQAAGLSLQDVCDRSGGAFVVSTLSAYEHGKRSLGLERLVELADIYGVSPMTLLDVEEPDEPALARMKPLRINLRNIQNLAPDERPPLEQYLDFLRRLRNDPAREVLTIRREDLSYLATLRGTARSPEESPAGGRHHRLTAEAPKRRDKGLASKPGAERVGANGPVTPTGGRKATAADPTARASSPGPTTPDRTRAGASPPPPVAPAPSAPPAALS